MDSFALLIKEKALSLGYANCGIIKIGDVADYAEKIDERMSRVHFGRFQFKQFRRYAHPQKTNTWAKSIVVLLTDNTYYNIPDELNGVYAKDFLVDGRLDKKSDAWERRSAFGVFLVSLGFRAVTEPKFGITALRLAASKAGLGIIRKNNFFYFENGSGVQIEAWLIDKELELIDNVELQKCPENCGKCIDSCPTKALFAPFTTSLMDCVSFLTSLSVDKGMGVPSARKRAQVGSWVYGCDACQDVCPFNKDKWTGGRDFPGLNNLPEKILPEKIMEMDYAEIAEILAPKFWYIGLNHLWKWKINALTAMANEYSVKYKEPIKLGLNDKNRHVRRLAKSISKKLGI